MEELANDFTQLIAAMQHNYIFALKLLSIFWAVHILNVFAGHRLNILGIIPRRWYGLPGIIFSPFLHGDFTHLFFNSIPFFVLSDLLLTEGHLIYYSVSIEVILLGGFCVWLVGKRGLHIGASGLIMGYFGYLLAKAYFQFTASTIIVAGLCLYYFGGLFLAIFPSIKKNISWEGHLFGFLSGIFAAYANKTILAFLGLITAGG